MRVGLDPLVTRFFGPKDISLERVHFDRIGKLVTRAWGWNSRLKGEVIMLGDFDQTAYTPASRFDPTLMEEFEPASHKPRAESILGTIAMGLVCRRAVGGGQPPEDTVVCKMLVVTNNVHS